MSLLGLGVVIYSIESIITLSKTLQYLYSISTNEEYKRKILHQIEYINRKLKEHFNKTRHMLSINPVGIYFKKIRRKVLPKITQSWDNTYESIDMDFIKIDDIDEINEMMEFHDFNEYNRVMGSNQSNESNGSDGVKKNHVDPELFYSCQDVLTTKKN